MRRHALARGESSNQTNMHYDDKNRALAEAGVKTADAHTIEGSRTVHVLLPFYRRMYMSPVAVGGVRGRTAQRPSPQWFMSL